MVSRSILNATDAVETVVVNKTFTLSNQFDEEGECFMWPRTGSHPPCTRRGVSPRTMLASKYETKVG